MSGHQLEIFARQQIRDVRTKVPRRILDDSIKPRVWVPIEPTPTIVNFRF
jgi:hypothetical protein